MTIQTINLGGKSSGSGAGDYQAEPEMTVDTPAPVPVAPPDMIASTPLQPLETQSIAFPIAHVTTANDPLASPCLSATAQLATCTVISPATLEGGYTFSAQVDGIDFIVTVPEGGVTEGQAFSVPYPKGGNTTTATTGTALVAPEVSPRLTPLELATAYDIPKGNWRSQMCDCCQVVNSGMFWQGFCCTPLLLGQVMTRSHLNAFGMPSASANPQSTFFILLSLWAGFWIVAFIFPRISWVLALLWIIYQTISAGNARLRLRQRYEIPIECCGDCDGACEDYCYALWCTCCLTIQMARHTNPKPQVYHYSCCTPRGLPISAPEIV